MHEPRCRFLQLVVDKIQGTEVLSQFPSIHPESEDEAEAILKYGYIAPKQPFESMPILPALLLPLPCHRYQIDQVSR